MTAGVRHQKLFQIAILYNTETGTVRGEPQDIIALQETENTAQTIQEALSTLGYQTNKISVNASLVELSNTLSNYSNQDTFIFNICDGFGGKNFGSVQVIELIEALGFKHTGATAAVIAQCTDKARAKEFLIRNGVPTPAYEIFDRPEGKTNLEFPIIVKPQLEDASLGIDLRSVVCTQAELLARVRYVIEQYDQPALVEEFVQGRELSVALLGNGEEIENSAHFRRRLLQHRRPSATLAHLRSQVDRQVSLLPEYLSPLPGISGARRGAINLPDGDRCIPRCRTARPGTD